MKTLKPLKNSELKEQVFAASRDSYTKEETDEARRLMEEAEDRVREEAKSYLGMS